MVQPSAHASHILVQSKSEALQIKKEITKLKDFEKFARKNLNAPQGRRRESWLVPIRADGKTI